MSISELSRRYGVSPGMIYQWKKQLFEGAVDMFKQRGRAGKRMADRVEQLEQKVRHRDGLISEVVADNVRLKKRVIHTQSCTKCFSGRVVLTIFFKSGMRLE